MSFREYLRLEGVCAIALGVVLVVLASAFGAWRGPAWEAPVFAGGISVLAVLAAGAATRSTLRKASGRPPRMAAGAIRRQTVVESVLWALAVAAWVVATGRDAELIAATGAATSVFGIVRFRAEVPRDALVDRRRYLIGARVTLARD